MTDTRKLFFLANFAVFIFLVYLLRPVLTPFLIAILLCYLCDPLVERTAERMGRTSSVILLLFCLLTVFIVALLTIIPIFQKQFAALIGALPAGVEYLNEQLIPQIEKLLFLQPGAIDASLIKTAVAEHLEQLNQVAKSLLSFVTSSGLSFFSLLMNLLLVPLVMFYLLRDWPGFISHIRCAIPEKNKQVVLMLTSRCNEVLGAFIRGQLVVMLVLGLFYGFGLTLVGLQMGLLIGFFAGLLSIVPYLGFSPIFLLLSNCCNNSISSLFLPR
jgi:predicted PurR-regulated permease PerM